MLMWVEPEDGFGQSLIRTIKRLLVIVAVVSAILGAVMCSLWTLVKSILVPIVRF